MTLKFEAGLKFEVVCGNCHEVVSGFGLRKREIISKMRGAGWEFHRYRKSGITCVCCPTCVTNTEDAKRAKREAVEALRATRKQAEKAYKTGLEDLEDGDEPETGSNE